MLTRDEPIPPFETRYPGKLESCISQPFQSFGGEEMYPTIPGKASALFYLMTKNHPFVNGNKRIAVVTMLYYLATEGIGIDASSEELYRLAVEVAQSNSAASDDVMKVIAQFINSFQVPFADWIDGSGEDSSV